MLDNIDSESDRHVADHVLGSHQYRRPGRDMAPEPLNASMHLPTFDQVLGWAILLSLEFFYCI